MISRAFLIAEREFRTYVATLSFWVALALGPLVLVAAVLIMKGTQSTIPVQMICGNVSWCISAKSALTDAAKLDSHRFAFVDGSAAKVRIAKVNNNAARLTFDNNFPLTPAGRAYVALRMERDALLSGISRPDFGTFRSFITATSPPAFDGAAASRFAVVMILWLTLTGSLGMLLQAIVRERSIRALESLLAAVSPWDIAVGKLLGIGAISMLVLVVWLGSASMLAIFGSGHASSAAPLLAVFASPLLLARAIVIYLFAYAFYGFTTLFIGASARDSASAQNLSRPMFVVLLAAFFVSFPSVTDSGVNLSWLLYLPPFAPFALLLRPPSDYSPITELSALVLLTIFTALAARMAVGRIAIAGASCGKGRLPWLREAPVQ